jgi:hypothetical protein
MKKTLFVLGCALLGFVLGLAILFTFEPVPEAHAASQFATIVCDNFKPFSVSANTQLITAGNGNMFIYICSATLSNGNAAAQPVSIVEGTGTTCATNTAGVIGNSTAAGGVALAINGTATPGSGVGAIARTAVAGDNVCLFTAAGPIGGVIAWTTAPF